MNCAITGESFRSSLVNWKKYSKVFFTPITELSLANNSNAGDLSQLINKFRFGVAKNSNNDTLRLGQYLGLLRQIKEPAELVLLRKAINISGDAHIELMKALEVGMTEYQVQAVIEYEFKKRGAEAVGYPSICGAGENSCILHYISNRKKMEKYNMIVV